MTNSLLLKMAHWNRWFTHQQWWCSIVMLVYPLVFFVTVCYSKWKTEMDLPIKNTWWFSVVCLPEATINFHGFNGKHEVLFRKFVTFSKIFSDILWYVQRELMMKFQWRIKKTWTEPISWGYKMRKVCCMYTCIYHLVMTNIAMENPW